MGNFFTKKRPYEYERELRALNIVYHNNGDNKESLNNSFLKNYRINLPKGQKTTAKKMLSMHNGKILPIYIPGKHIKIDLDILIENIYISPYVDVYDYFIDVIQSLIEKYDISNKSIVLSELYFKKI